MIDEEKFSNFVAGLAPLSVDDYGFGIAEGALHELCHWLTLGCPPLPDKHHSDITEYIANSLTYEEQDLNEICSQAVGLIVIDRFPSIFKRNGVSLTSLKNKIVESSFNNSQLAIKNRWGKAERRAENKWFTEIESKKKDPLVRACAESICLLLSGLD